MSTATTVRSASSSGTTGSHIVWSLPRVCSSTSTGPEPRRSYLITRSRPPGAAPAVIAAEAPPTAVTALTAEGGMPLRPQTLASTSERSPAICATSHGRTGAPPSDASSPPVASPISRTARPRSGICVDGCTTGGPSQVRVSCSGAVMSPTA